jgi:hypothetical protein
MGNRPDSPESATEWQLKLIVWEFFCTLTWSGRARSCGRKRRTHVTCWLRYWARTVRPGVAGSLGQLAFVIRWERGEIGGLPHCHILISRFPERSINPSTCFAMVNTWNEGAFLVSGRLRGREYIRAAQVQPGGLALHQSRRLGGNARSSNGGQENVAASVVNLIYAEALWSPRRVPGERSEPGSLW